MKPTIAAAAILLVGIYLMAGFASAINMNANAIARAKVGDRSVSLDEAQHDFDDETSADFNVKEQNNEIDSSVSASAKESTFAQVSLGQGWAISNGNSSNSSGSFIRLFWVEKTFVNNAGTNSTGNETNSTNQTSTETTKAVGALKIGSDMYKLTLSSQTDSSMTFDVVSHKDNVTGTLTLNSEVSLLGFTVWTGTLNLDNGPSYSIHVATQNSKVKGSSESSDNESMPGLKGNLNAETRGEGKKLGLFERIRTWFRGG